MDNEQFNKDSTALGVALLKAANVAASDNHKLVGAAIGDLVREYLHANPKELIRFTRYLDGVISITGLELAAGIKS